MSRKDLLSLFPLLKLPDDLGDIFVKEGALKSVKPTDKQKDVDKQPTQEKPSTNPPKDIPAEKPSTDDPHKDTHTEKPPADKTHDSTPSTTPEKPPAQEKPPKADTSPPKGDTSATSSGKTSETPKQTQPHPSAPNASADAPPLPKPKAAMLFAVANSTQANDPCKCCPQRQQEEETPMGSEKGGKPPPVQPKHDTPTDTTASDDKDKKDTKTDAKNTKKPTKDDVKDDKDKDDDATDDDDTKPKYHWVMQGLRMLPDAVLFMQYKSLVEFIYWYGEQKKWLEGVEEAKKEIPLQSWSQLYEAQRQGLAVAPVSEEEKLLGYVKAFARHWLSEWRRYQ